MPYLYYIDGYNVIHHCPELQALAQADYEAARNRLLELAVQFRGATGARMSIVFDGRGDRPQTDASSAATAGVEILYSPGHQSADTVIERAVYAAEDRRRIVVVSGDRGLRELCRALGTLVMAPGHFLTEVQAAERELRTTAERLGQPGQAIGLMEDRLDAEALRRLLRLRKKLDE